VVNCEVVQVSGESLKLSGKPKSERPVEFARPPTASRPSAADGLMRSKQLIEALLSVRAPTHQSHRRHDDVP
jgi:hypothetical protein